MKNKLLFLLLSTGLAILFIFYLFAPQKEYSATKCYLVSDNLSEDYNIKFIFTDKFQVMAANMSKEEFVKNYPELYDQNITGLFFQDIQNYRNLMMFNFSKEYVKDVILRGYEETRCPYKTINNFERFFG